jgi:hypothetical protein
MSYWANFKCPEHLDVFACPDTIIYFKSRPTTYGLIVHDGGSSFIEIEFCPWCGSFLGQGQGK